MAILVLWGYHLVNYLIPLQCWHWNCVFFLFQINHLSLGRSAFLIKTPFFTSKVTYTLWKKYDYKGFIFSIYRNQYWVGKNVNECDAHICIIRDRVGAIRAPPRGWNGIIIQPFVQRISILVPRATSRPYFGPGGTMQWTFLSWSSFMTASLHQYPVRWLGKCSNVPVFIAIDISRKFPCCHPAPDASLHRKSRPLHLWLW